MKKKRGGTSEQNETEVDVKVKGEGKERETTTQNGGLDEITLRVRF